MSRFSVLSALAAVCCAFVTASLSSAQSGTAGALTQPAITAMTVRDAPYSADAITTVTQILGDGTRVQRSVTAKVYRDSAGRTRREETVIGLASLTPAADGFQTITISDPAAGTAYTLNPRGRTALSVPLLPQLWAARGLPPRGLPAPPAGGARQGGASVGGGRSSPASAGTGKPPTFRYEPLGTWEMSGLRVTGRRTTQTISVGAIGNDRPIVITTDTWESPTLRLLVSSRHTDPRTGTVDYQLTNIHQTEPNADLFVVPAGYTVMAPSQMLPDAAVGRNQQPAAATPLRGRAGPGGRETPPTEQK
ncbi:MAG: hypothetical protein ACRD3G_08700 [Vicinamibacterales bacterium]